MKRSKLRSRFGHSAAFLRLQARRHSKYLYVPLLMFIGFNSYAGNPKTPCPEEQKSANQLAQKIKNEWPLRETGDPVSELTTHLGEKLAHLTLAGKHINWHFMVARNLEPNAYSIGDGYVIVTEGAIIMAENESEFAAIIAHELGHQLAGHFCREPEQIFYKHLASIFTSIEPISRIGHGSMTQFIDPIKEDQADQIALNLLEKGGFNPHAILQVSQRLLINNKNHYNDSKRLKALELAVRKFHPIKVESSKEFIDAKKNALESSGLTTNKTQTIE